MIWVRWRDPFGLWHERSFKERASALVFVRSCAEDRSVWSVAVAAECDDPHFWASVDDAMGFVGRDV